MKPYHLRKRHRSAETRAAYADDMLLLLLLVGLFVAALPGKTLRMVAPRGIAPRLSTRSAVRGMGMAIVLMCLVAALLVG